MDNNDKSNPKDSFDQQPEELDLYKEAPREPMDTRKRLLLGISAAVLICALGLALPTLLEAVYPAEPESGASAPVVQGDASGVLAVSVYAAEWEETVLQPGVSVALNEYSPLQSDVPGMPFVIFVPEGATGIKTDGIRIDVDAGTIVTWEPRDYTVRERGKTYICSSGSTIYWSPLDEQDTAISRCEMVVTAYSSNNEVYTQKIIISQTEGFHYIAELTDL